MLLFLLKKEQVLHKNMCPWNPTVFRSLTLWLLKHGTMDGIQLFYHLFAIIIISSGFKLLKKFANSHNTKSIRGYPWIIAKPTNAPSTQSCCWHKQNIPVSWNSISNKSSWVRSVTILKSKRVWKRRHVATSIADPWSDKVDGKP